MKGYEAFATVWSWVLTLLWSWLPIEVIFKPLLDDCGPILFAAFVEMSDCIMDGRLMLVWICCLKEFYVPLRFEKIPVPTTCTWFKMVFRWKSSLPYCVFGYPSTFRSASPLSTNSLFLYFLKLVCVLSSPLIPLFYFSSVLFIIDKCLFLFDEFCFRSRSRSASRC